jgi:hypothetical protein
VGIVVHGEVVAAGDDDLLGMREQLASARLEGQRVAVPAEGRQDGPVLQQGAQRHPDLLHQPGH